MPLQYIFIRKTLFAQDGSWIGRVDETLRHVATIDGTEPLRDALVSRDIFRVLTGRVLLTRQAMYRDVDWVIGDDYNGLMMRDGVLTCISSDRFQDNPFIRDGVLRFPVTDPVYHRIDDHTCLVTSTTLTFYVRADNRIIIDWIPAIDPMDCHWINGTLQPKGRYIPGLESAMYTIQGVNVYLGTERVWTFPQRLNPLRLVKIGLYLNRKVIWMNGTLPNSTDKLLYLQKGDIIHGDRVMYIRDGSLYIERTHQLNQAVATETPVMTDVVSCHSGESCYIQTTTRWYTYHAGVVTALPTTLYGADTNITHRDLMPTGDAYPVHSLRAGHPVDRMIAVVAANQIDQLPDQFRSLAELFCATVDITQQQDSYLIGMALRKCYQLLGRLPVVLPGTVLLMLMRRGAPDQEKAGFAELMGGPDQFPDSDPAFVSLVAGFSCRATESWKSHYLATIANAVMVVPSREVILKSTDFWLKRALALGNLKSFSSNDGTASAQLVADATDQQIRLIWARLMLSSGDFSVRVDNLKALTDAQLADLQIRADRAGIPLDKVLDDMSNCLGYDYQGRHVYIPAGMLEDVDAMKKCFYHVGVHAVVLRSESCQPSGQVRPDESTSLIRMVLRDLNARSTHRSATPFYNNDEDYSERLVASVRNMEGVD